MLASLLMSLWWLRPDGPFSVAATTGALELTASSAPAAASSMTRVELLRAAVASEKEKNLKRKVAVDLGLGLDVAATHLPGARIDGRRARVHESADQKRARILSAEYSNAAFCGQRLVAIEGGTKCLPHPQPCPRSLPAIAPGIPPLPCYHNLWPNGTAQLTQHLLSMMDKSQELRTQWVFERLRDQYYADPGPDGVAIGKARWHYKVNGREVCMRTFAAVHGVGESTLEGLQPRARADKLKAHAKHEEGSWQTNATRVDNKTISVIAWTLAYADEMGDLMPDEYAALSASTVAAMLPRWLPDTILQLCVAGRVTSSFRCAKTRMSGSSTAMAGLWRSVLQNLRLTRSAAEHRNSSTSSMPANA